METEEELDDPMAMDSSDDESVVKIEAEAVQPKKNDVAEKTDQALLEEANAIIDDWLNNDQVCNDFLFEDATRLPESLGEKMTIEQVISSFDTMKYFKMKGKDEFPLL